ncbi:hypothetical protein EJ05DRAFT_499430 [Pseudovirgaria hyperparasitica]|uniref:Uncharacterized protein n=1 Tax=Pseudovirgaria hyperparasitica TaxID=470096 RepID=A0A6A6WBN0_9PEZI|nr:uncharacterized protein EJ05DRAFT_499430 [Pseudovirgaria hyperparasitica]KAF2759007.1 hypothetical protein EJ05DRAFT_499430 [Pseudovirgaria hyperparasitica]
MSAETLYAAYVPQVQDGLEVLKGLLTKAQSHGLSDSAILEARIIDDMWPLARQIAMCVATTTLVKVGAISEASVPKYDSFDPTSVADALARIADVEKVLAGVKEEGFAQSEGKVWVKWFGGPHELEKKDYVMRFAVPNFYFHLSMVYAILRKEGVNVGKKDFVLLGEETRVEGEGYPL